MKHSKIPTSLKKLWWHLVSCGDKKSCSKNWRKKVKVSRISAKPESLFSARFGRTSDRECYENFCRRLSSVNWTHTWLVRATTLGRTVASRAEWEKSKRSGLADIRDSLTFFLLKYKKISKQVFFGKRALTEPCGAQACILLNTTSSTVL